MVEKQIKLESIEDVKEFVSAVTVAPFDADLTADRFVVDAKSILGIFSLNLANIITLQIHAEEGPEVDKFLDAIAQYVVK